MRELIGIYDADGGLWGEISYVVGKLAGVAHCSLCDVTHGWNPGGRARFTEAVRALPVPFTTRHRNELDADLQGFVAGSLPCVVARMADGFVRVLGPEDLDPLRGDIDAFFARLRERLPAVPIDAAAGR